MLKIKRIFLAVIWLLVIGILVYSRFVNLGWGLPYPMHPDERNMAVAIQGLNCEISNFKFPASPAGGQISNCFNPHFFAYGQFPLYLGYIVTYLLKFFDGDLGYPISFEEAVLSLRFISAVASILNVFVLLKIINLLIFNQFLKFNSNFKFPASPAGRQILNFLVLIFSPFFIQFAHFGTTESILMLLYSTIIYVCLLFLNGKILNSKFLILNSILCGLAIASKVSSVLFLAVPLATLIKFGHSENPDVTSGDSRIVVKNNDSGHLPAMQSKALHAGAGMTSKFFFMIKLVILTLVFSIIFSPHNFISFPEFLGSMAYESDVALGSYRAFYTRQFEETIPILFQLEKILPFALGWPVLTLSFLGFFFLPFRKEFNLIRFAIITIFLPNAFLYAKWTRFTAPILPMLLVIAILFLEFLIFNFQSVFNNLIFKHFKLNSNFKFPASPAGGQISNYVVGVLLIILTLLSIVPGLAYLSVYQKPDIRFTASEWIFRNIPDGSYILSETANVVDIPLAVPEHLSGNYARNYQVISFDYYHLDENPDLKSQLGYHLAKADYIFVPSRRLFKNNIKDYPLLNDYYQKLFSGNLGFAKVAEFNSFPKIQLFGITLYEAHDENAEETWTVFDHPVIRIYKKI